MNLTMTQNNLKFKLEIIKLSKKHVFGNQYKNTTSEVGSIQSYQVEVSHEDVKVSRRSLLGFEVEVGEVTVCHSVFSFQPLGRVADEQALEKVTAF